VQFLGPFWFRAKLKGSNLSDALIPHLYWRQKSSYLCNEFEVRFEPPVTGVSSGWATVGAHVIVDTDDENSFVKYKISNTGVIGKISSISSFFYFFKAA
jgi:hypothetical protein